LSENVLRESLNADLLRQLAVVHCVVDRVVTPVPHLCERLPPVIVSAGFGIRCVGTLSVADVRFEVARLPSEVRPIVEAEICPRYDDCKWVRRHDGVDPVREGATDASGVVAKIEASKDVGVVYPTKQRNRERLPSSDCSRAPVQNRTSS
jgi:hypothetical protein